MALRRRSPYSQEERSGIIEANVLYHCVLQETNGKVLLTT
jgi:hypothetical protein